MTKPSSLGIIGSGAIGAAIARLAVANDIDITIANSRGPASLDALVAELGPRAAAGTVDAAARFGELTVLAVPLMAYDALPLDALRGRYILSTGNYYPHRDGRIETLDSLQLATAELEQSLLPGTTVVKAFNNIVAHHIPLLANSDPRSALPIAGDDIAAKRLVINAVEALGFDTVDAGSLADSWTFEPESGAYTSIYFEGELGPDYLSDPGSPVSAEQLKELLAVSSRPNVRERQF